MADHHDITDVDEQPVFHHTGDLVQHQRQLARVADPLQMQIDDVIGLVGDQRTVAVHPQRHVAVQHIHRHQGFLKQRLGGLPAKGDNLDRQGKGAKLGNLFGGIGDHDHLIRCRRHDLFLQQGRPAALDQAKVLVKLIRAVDGQVQPFRLIQRDDLNADLPRQFRRAGRGRHALDPQALFAHPLTQTAHHPGGGRAGAKPDLHAGLHEIHSALGGDELGLVDRGKVGGHGGLLSLETAYRQDLGKGRVVFRFGGAVIGPKIFT